MTPSKAQQKLPNKVSLVASQRDALLPQLLCSVPTQVDAGLQEWWFTRDRRSCAANQPMDRLLAVIVVGEIMLEKMLGIWVGLLETQVCGRN